MSVFNKYLFCFVLVFLSLTITVYAENPRLAIVDDGTNGDLVSLLTAELSKNPEVTLLERSEIDKITRENEFQLSLSKNDFSRIGQLLKADGLIIFRNIHLKNQNLNCIRLVDTNYGIVIDSMVLPNKDIDITQITTQIIERFEPLFIKFSTIKSNNNHRLSLLGFHSELGGEDTNDSEKNINTFIVTSLLHYPNIFVLERTNMEKLSWEKDLSSESSSPFWTGSTLIDGIIHDNGETIDVNIRLRNSESDSGKKLHCAGKKSDLPGLVNQMSENIVQALRVNEKPIPWNPIAESDNYRKLAEWALRTDQQDLTLEACQTSLVLNKNNRNSLELMIKLLSKDIYRDEDVLKQIERTKLLMEVVNDDLKRHQKNADYNITAHAFLSSLQFIRNIHDKGLSLKLSNKLTRLQSDLHDNIDLYDKYFPESFFLTENGSDVYLWCATPEDAIAEYRHIIDHIKADDETTFYHSVNRNLQKLKLAEWYPKDEERIPRLTKDFISELTNSPDLYKQMTGYTILNNTIEFHSKETEIKLLKCYEKIRSYIWENRDKVVAGKLPIGPYVDALCLTFPNDEYIDDRIYQYQVKLFKYILENSESPDMATLLCFESLSRFSTRAHYDSNIAFRCFSRPLATELLKDIDNYEKRAAQTDKYTSISNLDMRYVSSIVIQMKYACNLEISTENPDDTLDLMYAKFERTSPKLKTTHISYHAFLQVNEHDPELQFCDIFDSPIVTYNNGNIVCASHYMIWSIDLITHEQKHNRLKFGQIFDMGVSKDYIYLLADNILKLNKELSVIDKLSIPIPHNSISCCTICDNYLYLGYDNFRDYAAGLIKVDLGCGKYDVLLSNNRYPSNNSLEKKLKLFPPRLAFVNSAGKTFVAAYSDDIGQRLYAYDLESHDWTKVHLDFSEIFPFPEGSLFVLYGSNPPSYFWMGKDDDHPVSICLDIGAKKLLNSSQWQFTPKLYQYLKDNKFLMDHGNLWVYSSSELLFFDKTLLEPIIIPLDLSFTSSPKDQPVNTDNKSESFRVSKIMLVPEGLLIIEPQGFWFIPRKDLEDYIAQAKISQKTTATP